MKTAVEIQAWLTEQIAAILSISEDEIDPDETFDSFGLASRDAVSLSGDLEDYLERRLSPTLLYQYPTIRELAEHLAEGEKPAPPRPVGKPGTHVKPAATHAPAQQKPVTPLPPAQGASANEPIAIIGLACRFPGADSAEAFWDALAAGRDLITEVPADRWDREGLYDPEVGAPGKMSTKWGGFLSDVAGWDAHFFGVSPREAARMDPQQRLLCEAAWEAFEDARIPPDALAGSNTGVFVGISSPDYSRLQIGVAEHMDAYTGTGNAFSIAANRISYLFDFRGPSLAVDTACSSSLVSTHLACLSLARRECDLALAGGVNVILSPEVTISFSQAHMMAADGRCKTFDAAADGYVRGEGVGVVALKRLADAERDGDRIIAIIRGSAVNQDGRSNGLTAPNPDAQATVIRQALANAQVEPQQVSYIEAHGTGTALGDPIELRGLSVALGEGRAADAPLAVASLKTNIGHLESAAGIAGLIKVCLMLQRGQIPPSLHFQQPNPHFDFAASPLRVQTKLAPWTPSAGSPRIAGISSFGFGGTNAHVIVSEYQGQPKPALALPDDDRPFLLPLSAASSAALERQARRWIDFLRTTDAAPASIATSAATARAHHDFRLAVVGKDAAEWRAGLEAFLAHETAPGLRTGQRMVGKRHRVALVYSGQGTQWAGMGVGLLAEPVFAAEVEAIDALWQPLAGWSIVDALRKGDALDQTAVAQPAIFALQAGLTAVLRDWGLNVEGATGHSVGEIAAAYAGGILSRADAVRVLYHRSRLMQAATGQGKMAAVGVSEAEARELLAGREADLSLAAINSPSLVTVSGKAEAVDAVVAAAQARGIFTRPLGVNYAFHSPQMDPFLTELRECVEGTQPQHASLAVFSTVSGALAAEGDYGADYWPRNVRQTVRFLDAIRGLAEAGFDAFIEVSPHAGMVRSISECLPQSVGYVVAGSLQRGKPERETLLALGGELYCAGLTPAWPPEWPVLPAVDIPRYAWNRQRYWSQVPSQNGLASPTIAIKSDGQAAVSGHPLVGREVRSPALRGTVFEQLIAARQPAYLTDHRVAGEPVLPATAYLEMALFAGRHALRTARVGISDVALERLLPLGAKPRAAQVVIEDERASIYSDDGRAWNLHATATVRADDSLPVGLLDLADIQNRCGADISVPDFYAELRQHGLEYGPTFRGVRKLWRCAGEALGRVELPSEVSANGYIVHPALLDACFHVVAAALPEAATGGTDIVHLPVAVERLTVAAEGEGLAHAWAHVTLREGQAGEVVADARLALDNGRVVAEVSGLRLRAAPRKMLELMLAAAREAAGEPVAPKPQPAPENIDGWAYKIAWEGLPALPAPAGKWAEGRWLLLADEGGVAARLKDALAAAGGDITLIAPDDDIALAVKDAAASGATLRGLIHLAASGPDGFLKPVGSALAATKALARLAIRTPASARLWIVTRGAVAAAEGDGANPTGAALWGFGHVAALEHAELKPARIDLDDSLAAEQLLLAELAASTAEDRVALRGDRRLGARLVRAALPSAATASRDAPLRLEITERGMLDNLARVPMTRIEPAAGQVEIEVVAAGLNFRDVMNLLGLYPGDAGLLGGECAGVVTRVGAGVTHVKPGDRVLAIAPGCFGAYTTTHAQLVAPIPNGMSFEDAATLPIAFLTAHYALNRLGKMQAGDRVLIHAASGGVGLAAIQLAQLAGATVYATAGSPAKREFLQGLGLAKVMNSRNLSFSEETLAATGGRGVDLVLNSLSGNFIPKSLAALAPEGRFLEIGKVGIWDPAQVAKVRPGAAYHTIALDDLSARQPELIAELLAELLPHFAAGRLKPLTKTVYPVEDATSAFRLMAQTRHIGKVVIAQPKQVESAPTLRPDATYLITGGLGSLGMLVAGQLVSLGARNLLLVGVTQPSEAASAKIAELEGRGARILVRMADASVPEEAQAALDRITAEGMPALRGIIHAAGVLDDGMIVQQEWSRFDKVLRPKAAGAWNLHRLTEGRDLDFFVMFSSVASVLGSPGQSNYAAANAFLDGLAAQRAAAGLPGLSINWGPWSVGMAAAGDDRDRKRREASGLAAIEPDKGLEAFTRLVLGGANGQMMIAPVLWPALRRQIAAGEEPAFLKPLLEASAPAAKAETTAAPSDNGKPPLVLTLEAAAPRERLSLLTAFIRDRALKVLALEPDFPLDTRKPMNEMGFDSLMAVELKNALDAGIGRKLPATLVFEHPTIDALAKHLLENVLGLGGLTREADNKAEAAKPVDRAPISEEAVAEMSEEEAEAALLQKLLELDE